MVSYCTITTIEEMDLVSPLPAVAEMLSPPRKPVMGTDEVPPLTVVVNAVGAPSMLMVIRVPLGMPELPVTVADVATSVVLVMTGAAARTGKV